MRVLPFTVASLALTGGAFAQDKYGTVRTVESKEIWKADGMTVEHVQFTPDGTRIRFTARGKDSVLRGSVLPDGTGFETDPVDAAPADADGAVPAVGFRDEKCAAASPDGKLIACTRDLISPVGIVRGAGLWVRRSDVKVRGLNGVLDPAEWLVGVAYYEGMIAWAPPEKGEKENRRIRFIGARIQPFPGLRYRPLCVWEVTINEKLERVGEPVKLGTFGWWPRFFRGDPALHGATGWNVGIDDGQYMADFSTGKVYKFADGGFGQTSATYSSDCSLVALPGQTLRVLKLEKKE